LNEPANTTSSQTQTFACRKSCVVPGAHGVERLPAKRWRSRIRSSTGPFHRAVGLALHWRSTSPTWVASTTPVTSTSTQSSERRIGPAVSSGLAMRTRRRARAIAAAIRFDRSGPWPGQNHGRTGTRPTPNVRTGSAPEPSTRRRRQRSSKSARYAAATPRSRTRRITFSWRSHESIVQFVEPVSTASPSRTTNLWCMRSGSPGIARVGNGSDSMSDGSVFGGGESSGLRGQSWL